MVRTSFRDEKYFTEKLSEMTEDYPPLLQTYAKLKQQKGEGYPGHETVEFMLSDNLLMQIRARYSRGDSIQELKPLLTDALHYFLLAWDDATAYTDVLSYASLCVLLDVDAGKFLAFLEEKQYLDHNLFFLLRAKTVPEVLIWQDQPDQLLKRITESDPASAVVLLKEYLDKLWYPQFKSEPWYNSHKPENKNAQAYLGYWCFESAAVVKVMGLDDGILKGEPYYPYDLVHG